MKILLFDEVELEPHSNKECHCFSNDLPIVSIFVIAN